METCKFKETSEHLTKQNDQLKTSIDDSKSKNSHLAEQFRKNNQENGELKSEVISLNDQIAVMNVDFDQLNKK